MIFFTSAKPLTCVVKLIQSEKWGTHQIDQIISTGKQFEGLEPSEENHTSTSYEFLSSVLCLPSVNVHLLESRSRYHNAGEYAVLQIWGEVHEVLKAYGQTGEAQAKLLESWKTKKGDDTGAGPLVATKVVLGFPWVGLSGFML